MEELPKRGTLDHLLFSSNGDLVNQQLGIDRKWLHPLPMLTPVVIESRGKPVGYPFDANHCPGAVMFVRDW
jgi:DNA cross-link repair 1A protein